MGTKMSVAVATIFVIFSKSIVQPTVWKRYVDDIFSLGLLVNLI